MKWGKILRFFVLPALLLGLPLYLSTDGFLTWLYEKAYTDHWSSAPAVTLRCASYYQWTFREERAAAVYRQFLERWPENEGKADAAYGLACALRDVGAALEYTSGGNPELRGKREQLRTEAQGLFEAFAAEFPADSRADVARRAAQGIRDGH